ncbi:armadillo-type protein [Obelidium mucronatum]|nr:armadillo-type protein [Obelidium mucronatum]
MQCWLRLLELINRQNINRVGNQRWLIRVHWVAVVCNRDVNYFEESAGKSVEDALFSSQSVLGSSLPNSNNSFNSESFFSPPSSNNFPNSATASPFMRAPGGIRRARAETFSAFPSDYLSEAPASPINLTSIPSSPMGLGFRQNTPQPSKLKTSFDEPNEPPLHSNITRTFAHLGLDDDYSPQQQSANSSNGSSSFSNSGVPIGNRLRAQSNVGGTPPSYNNDLSRSIPHAPSSSFAPKPGSRPRATTIGIVDRFVVDGVDMYGMQQGIGGDRVGSDRGYGIPLPSSYSQQHQQHQQQQQPQHQTHHHHSQQHHSLQQNSVLLQSTVTIQGFSGTDEGNEHDQDFQTPSRSLWVGNLDATISAPEILSLFSPFGAIESLRMLPDKECVFVNFVRVEDALAAKEGMMGRKIGSGAVRLGFGKNEAVGDTQGMQPTKSVWIGNIPQSIGSADLEKMFTAFGPVESCRVLTHKSCGFVNFESLQDAMRAQHAMNGQEIHGMAIKVGFAKVPSKAELSVNTMGGASLANSFPQSNMSPQKTGRPGLSGNLGGVDGFLGDDSIDGRDSSESYAVSLIALPEPDVNRLVDQSRLREMRKRLENPTTDYDEVMSIFAECYDEAVELCTDYIGNVVLQKLVDKSDDQHRALLIEKLSAYLASLGVHKNGTWVVQKIIDSARTPTEAALIVKSLKPYAPCLLLDQFGNYVIQCCLRLGIQGNQFIFDAMQHKCLEIATGRFGSRAMRSCLESQYTTKRQQKHVAVAVTQFAMQLVTNINGSIIIAWLLDTSSLPGRFRVLAPKLAADVPALCRHKLASATILKLINQRIELDARDLIIKEIFFHDYDESGTASNLREIISDHTQGVAVIQKILAAGCVSPEERVRFADRVRTCVGQMMEVKTNPMAYKRLLDEVAAIPSGLYGDNAGLGASGFGHHQQDIVSPLTPNIGYFSNPYGAESGSGVGNSDYYAQPAYGNGPAGMGYNAPQQQQNPMSGSYATQQQYYGQYSQPSQHQQQQYSYRDQNYH